MLTTQKQIRALFWDTFPDVDKKKIKNYSGEGKMYCTDTRCIFADWLDGLRADGVISEALAYRATL